MPPQTANRFHDFVTGKDEKVDISVPGSTWWGVRPASDGHTVIIEDQLRSGFAKNLSTNSLPKKVQQYANWLSDNRHLFGNDIISDSLRLELSRKWRAIS